MSRFAINSHYSRKSNNNNYVYQHMPDVLVGSLERAESNGDSEDTLASPVLAGYECHLFDVHGLAAVDQEFNGLVHISREDVLERVVVLVEARAVHGHDKVEKGLEAGPRPGRRVLHLNTHTNELIEQRRRRRKTLKINTLRTW